MITLEEARVRQRICNGHIKPRQRADGSWFCDNCGLDLRSETRNISGFCHDYDSGNYKICSFCEKEKEITEFYYRHGALDRRENHCKDCARKATARRSYELDLKGRSRTIWLPDDLWNAVQKVRGKLTFRDFIIVAVRKEVERRARDMYTKKTLEEINKNKPVKR